jgi:hypothetical protein
VESEKIEHTEAENRMVVAKDGRVVKIGKW